MPFITVNGRKLHYADTAEADGEPASPPLTIIMIHGLGSSQNYYYPILPRLSKFRCITFDTYGAGRSKYDGQEQSIATIAEDVLGLLDALKMRKALVVGHSMGGIVVSHLAATASSRVHGVVGIGPVNPSSNVAQVFGNRIKIVKDGGMEPLANTIPKAATGSYSTPLHRAFIRELLLGQDPEGYISNCQVIAQAQPPAYEKVKVPFLLIAGEDDKSASLEGCTHIYNSVASDFKKMEVLEGVGHWHCIEAGDQVGDLIAGFCREFE